MDPQQRAFAEDVNNDLQKTGVFGADDALVVVELIYYTAELFKMCYPNKADAKAYLAENYNGTSFSPAVMRPAVRQTRRAARKKRMDLTDPQTEAAAHATLLRALNADDNVVAACYSAMPTGDCSDV